MGRSGNEASYATSVCYNTLTSIVSYAEALLTVELHSIPSSRVTKSSSVSPLRVKMKMQPRAVEPVAKVQVRKTRLSDAM